jgi:hypothetical protein
MPAPGPHEDCIPAPDGVYNLWISNIAGIWDPTEWNCVVPPTIEVGNAAAAFNTALLTASDPTTRTRQTIAQKDQVREVSERMFRNIVRIATAAYRAGAADSAALVGMGIRVPELTRTPILSPPDAPSLAFVEARPGVIQYRLTQVVGGVPVTVRKFPYGSVGVRLVETWTGNERVTTIKRVNIVTPTKGIPIGTVITARACYFTARGAVSPLCPTVDAVVT